MSTGDLKNNVRKLQAVLKRTGYTDELNYDKLSHGLAEGFLPLYHHVMVNYSIPLAKRISDLNIELTGKTDLRFVEAMYKVMREVFNYKPVITKDKFFTGGFGERKIIMCTEVITLIKDWHTRQAPKTTGRPSTGQGCVTGRHTTGKATGGASSVLVEHNIKPMQKSLSSSTPSQSNRPRSAPQRTQPSLKSSAQDPLPSQQSAARRPVNSVSLTPANKPDMVSSGSIDQSGDGASLPVIPAVVKSGPDMSEVMPVLTTIQQKMTDLCNRLGGLEGRLTSVEGLMEEASLGQAQLNERVGKIEAASQQQGQSILVPGQLETILARITLAESRISMVEKGVSVPKQKSPTIVQGQPSVQIQSAGNQENDCENRTVSMTSAGQPSLEQDIVMPSPIIATETVSRLHLSQPGLIHLQEKAINSSTVTTSTPTDDAPNQGFLYPNSTQASRISQMLKDTESLLNIEVQSPARQDKLAAGRV